MIPAAGSDADDRPELIRVDGLTRRYGALAAVDGISFQVKRGELFGIVGPDGAGKTTLLRMLAGVHAPTGGDATLRGLSVRANPEGVKAHIAYMPQRFGLYTDLTVRENLDFYADLYEVPRAERASRLARLYGFSRLGPFEERLAGKLSGGMKQKLALSCALIHKPEILLLDEPTFGVDPISRRDLWLIVHEMVAEGVTAVVSTSYMDEAERFDRVALLHHGRIVACETPEALRRRWKGELISVAVERARAARPLVERHPAASRVALFGDRLHVGVESADRDGPAIREALTGAGFRVTEIVREEPSLEDVFMVLVGEEAA